MPLRSKHRAAPELPIRVPTALNQAVGAPRQIPQSHSERLLVCKELKGSQSHCDGAARRVAEHNQIARVAPSRTQLAPGDGRKINKIRGRERKKTSAGGNRLFECTEPNDLCLCSLCTVYGHRRTMSGTWLRSQDLERINQSCPCAAVACFTSTTRSKSSIRFI
jgi:hypothetical protein